MAKFVCTVCGWSTEADKAPERCPLCGATTFKEINTAEGKVYACEHKVGDGKVEDKEVMEGLRAHFAGECTEVGMYLAMARVAEREGYPEVAEAYKRYAFEEAEHAAKFAELLGEVVTDSTKKNLELRAEAEHGACEGKLAIAARAKQLGYDAIHDTVHEMAKDRSSSWIKFDRSLKRYFITIDVITKKRCYNHLFLIRFYLL